MKNFLRVFCVIVTCAVSPALCANEPASIESMVTEDVVALATVDLTQVKLPQLVKWGIESGLVPESEARNRKFSATAAQGWISGLVDSGVQRITVLAQLSDLQTQAPIWVATLADGADSDAAMEALSGTVELLPIKSQALALRDGLIVGGLDQTTVDQWAVDAAQRPEFNEIWQELVGFQTGLALFGNKDTRRVVREMLPDLPAPFEEATRELIADHVSWGGIQIDLPPNVNAGVVVHSTDQESAKTCQRLISAIMNYSINQMKTEIRNTDDQAIWDALKPTLDVLEPTLEENRVRLSLNPLLEKEGLASTLAAYRKSSAGPRRQNNLRQVILAILNYESANQAFPTAAIYSDAGRPLLSWRVAILPFLNQQDLYDKFRLDERWDSPHNLKVSRDMPEFYQDPEHEHHNVNWRTMVQVPHGEKMLFQGKEATKFSDVKDGSSNTIALVYADPSKAVYWTKPSDWEADLDNPWDGLKRDNAQTVIVGLADGFVQPIDVSMPPEKLRAMLTRDGGETIKP